MNLKVKRMHEDAVIPQYAHEGDSGFDLVAVSDVIIEPGETIKVPTGLAFEIPQGFELQVRPRSGITAKTKLRVQLGTVDAGYTGEVSVIVDNIFDRDEEDRHDIYSEVLTISGDLTYITHFKPFGSYIIRKGERIAQAVLAPIVRAEITEVDELEDSVRGANGFGSSGVSAD